ncbi:MAG: response regulator [Candidatus Cloacimonadota bacterium]|nr:MAG: response regulator [Candidatus Cloacimonadota bacterium]
MDSACCKNAILIVEDNEDMQLLLTTILADEGFLIHQAYEEKSALKIFERVKPQLVLLDLRLPGIDGISVYKKMKEIDKDVMVFIITAYGDKYIERKVRELGANDYFTKPFDNRLLIENIKNTLSKIN